MFPVTRQVLSSEQRLALMSPALLDEIADRDDPYDALLADAYARAPTAGFFARVSFAEARTYMHDVLLRDTDQMSMAHALEVRVPFLDHRLVQYVTSVPDSVKRSNGVPKKLLLDSLPDLVPAEVAHRPKQGFTLPFDVWMRGALRPFCEAHLGPDSLVANGLMRADTLGQLWESFLACRRDVSWSRVWVIPVLDAWLQQVGGLVQ